MPFNKLNHSHLGEIRPRFALKSSESIESIIHAVNVGISEDESVLGVTRVDYAVIKIPNKDLHYWSPELQVRLEIDEFDKDGKTDVLCLVGPRPPVWTLFLFIYAVIGISALIGGIYGLSNLQLGHESIFIWFLPAGLILIPTIYILAKIGQKKGRDQMLHLISFVYHRLESIGSVERIEK